MNPNCLWEIVLNTTYLDKVTECDIKINNILLPHDIKQFQIITRVRPYYMSDSEPLTHTDTSTSTYMFVAGLCDIALKVIVGPLLAAQLCVGAQKLVVVGL